MVASNHVETGEQLQVRPDEVRHNATNTLHNCDERERWRWQSTISGILQCRFR